MDVCKRSLSVLKSTVSIVNTFIFARGIGFLLNNNIRMKRHKVFVIKRDMTDDTKTVGGNDKLEDIAKMSIDIQLFNFRIS